MTQFHVTWRVFPQQDLVQMSGVLSGLAELARSGAIELCFEYRDDVAEVPLSLMELVVRKLPTHESKTIAIDFYDRSDKVIYPSLDRVDVYFKRQYNCSDVNALPTDGRAKIRSLGLTLSGFSKQSWHLVAAAITASLRTRKARAALNGWGKLLYRAAADARMWLRQLPPGLPASLPNTQRRSQVIFQPRLWSTTPGSGDLFDVANDDRIATVRALRKAFASLDTIGLVHSPTARRIAPELRLATHVRTREYLSQLSHCTIAVNCVGLSGSVGWKFAEYLAAGNAIVSQRIDKALDPPIEAGVHYLPYDSPEQCVEQCRRLLQSPDQVANMGRVNRAYYDRWVHPPALVANVLHRTFVD